MRILRLTRWSLLVLCILPMPMLAATITINQAVTHQTIIAWGMSAGVISSMVPDRLKPYVINELVNGIGLNRLRIEGVGGAAITSPSNKGWEFNNDNADPDSINWSVFNTAGADYSAAKVWTPFRLLVEAKGETFNTYTSASFFDNGSTGSIPPWLLNSPGEYSENILSLLLYIKDHCGFTPTYCTILNEAGNGNPVTSLVIRNVIKVLGPRMRAAGLTTKIEGPECMAADQSWSYLNASPNGMRYDAEAMKYVGLLSYHLYGTNDPARASIRDFGIAQNIPTAMTEYMSSISVNNLYDDLTLGGVSVWDFYALNEYMPFTNNSNTWFTTNNTYWQCGQIMRYVRPGAVRVDATADNASLRPLAFTKNGATTLVIFNNTNGGAISTTINGLPNGSYGMSETDNGGTYYQEKGVQAVTGAFTLTVPNNSIITLYPRAGGNLPPVVTDRSAFPSYLTLPASTTTLSASAQDPEAGTLSYSWSVKSKPSAATVVFASPTSASTAVSGLTAAGEYVFTLTVSDGATTAAKDLAIPVFNGNQPPDLVEFFNRRPTRMVLPTSSTSLSVWARDVESDSLSYQWSVVAKPSSANVTLGSPTSSTCAAQGLSVAGDYLMRLSITDPSGTLLDTLPIHVDSANAHAPVITSITSTPASPISTDSVALAAITSDPDGDWISHWWTVKSAPAAATPVFSRPGSPNTKATNMTVAGTYVFTLIVVDRTLITTRDITIVRGLTTAIPLPHRHQAPRSIDHNSWSFTFDAPAAVDASLDLFTLQGKRMARIDRHFSQAGQGEIQVDASAFKPGAYVWQLRVGSETTRGFIIPGE